MLSSNPTKIKTIFFSSATLIRYYVYLWFFLFCSFARSFIRFFFSFHTHTHILLWIWMIQRQNIKHLCPNWHSTTAMMATVTSTTAATTNPLTFIHIYLLCASLFRSYLSRSSLFSLFSVYLGINEYMCIPKHEYMPIPMVQYGSQHIRTQVRTHTYMCRIHVMHTKKCVRTNLHMRSSIGVSVMQWSRRTDAYMFCTLIH